MMDKPQYKCLLISDFNISNLGGYLDNDNSLPLVSTTIAPFGQVIPTLLECSSEYWRNNPDAAIIWTKPESVIKSFKDVLNFKRVPLEQLFMEVDDFSNLILKTAERIKALFIPIWVFPSYNKGYGMLDMKNETGIMNTLMRMNLRLADNFARASNIYMLNTQKWVEITGKDAFNSKLWYMGKIAFDNQVFKEAVKDLKSALRGISGNARKLVIVDLDNTLWGGIVGEIGWEKIRLGGHDFIGEAFVDFQKALKSLVNRGILLGIVSKNEESAALEAINNNPEMVLKLNDFAGWRINWKDKATNITDLVQDLNLGLQSVVFIDDNPAERAWVMEKLPEVLVPDWPEDVTLYKRSLMELGCFDVPSISEEDVERNNMYIIERQRRELKNTSISLEEWQKTLDLKVKVEDLNTANIQRTLQLLNKTNQMNLRTRRLIEPELLEWIKQPNHKMWTFRVSDKFGDLGLVGIISMAVEGNQGRILDFVLSCRVFGRKIEETMLYVLLQYSKAIGLERVYAEYIPTSRNRPCLEFWKNSGFLHAEPENIFSWDIKDEYLKPDIIEIIQ